MAQETEDRRKLQHKAWKYSTRDYLFIANYLRNYNVHFWPKRVEFFNDPVYKLSTILSFLEIRSTANRNGLLGLADTSSRRIFFGITLATNQQRDRGVRNERKGQVTKMSVIFGVLFLAIAIVVNTWRESKAFQLPPGTLKG